MSPSTVNPLLFRFEPNLFRSRAGPFFSHVPAQSGGTNKPTCTVLCTGRMSASVCLCLTCVSVRLCVCAFFICVCVFFVWGAYLFLSSSLVTGYSSAVCSTCLLLSYICSPGLPYLNRTHTGAGTQGRHGTGLDKNTRQNGQMQSLLCIHSYIINDKL